MTVTDISLIKYDTIGELVLNYQETRNAITRSMWRKIPALLGDADNDPGIHVLLVHGGKTGAFSAGADINELSALADNPDEAARFLAEMSIALGALATFPKPVIARVHGPCIGAGLALALCCDIRLACTSACFGVTPAKLGLTYPLADTRRLVTLIGPARAKDLILSSRLIDAEDALRIGLVEQVIPTDDLVGFTHKYARQMSQRSPHTQAAMKNIINTLSNNDPALERQAREIFVQSFSGADFKEGFAAFTQKRKPDFS